MVTRYVDPDDDRPDDEQPDDEQPVDEMRPVAAEQPASAPPSAPKEFPRAPRTPEPEDSENQAEKHAPVYPDAQAWVTEFMLPHFRRRPNAGPFRWDPRWWAYEESGTVIEGLWETWEKMRWDGATGILDYFRDYFYPLLRELTGSEGPFWAYDPPKQEVPPEVWPTEPVPKGWFRVEGFRNPSSPENVVKP